MKANLFLIGAMKSGTTALYYHLASHPQISMSRRKEPQFFCHALGDHPPNSVVPKTIEQYHALFTATPEALYYGEATERYSDCTVFEGVPERIFDYNPDARIVYLVRHPIRRLISQYHHQYRHGHEKRPILEAVRQSPEFMDKSDYALQLSRYRDVFPHDQILTLISERYRSEPADTFATLGDWLGLAPHDQTLTDDVDHSTHVTPTSVGPPRFGIKKRKLAILQATRPWKTVSRAMPDSIKDLARKLIYANRISTTDIPFDAIRDCVGSRLIDSTNRFREMVNDTVPEWGADLVEPESRPS